LLSDQVDLHQLGRLRSIQVKNQSRRTGGRYLGSQIDPAGPIQHRVNDGDPWLDTWLCTNPIFVDVG